MNNQILNVTNVSEEQEAKDGRFYKVISVERNEDNGVISTARTHKKTIFSHQPMQGPGTENPQKNAYYEKISEGVKIVGRIETVETEPYFIENENGQYTHPETQKPANRATQKTYVLFEDESVDRLLNNDELTRRGEEQQEQASEQLVAEDLGEEAEEVEVS